MKIVLIGHGAMGKLIGTLSEEKNHQITAIIDESEAGLTADKLASKLKHVDVAIDFSTAEAVQRNVKACVVAGVPMVEGTTGWNSRRIEIENFVKANRGAVVFGANFSIGVNLFYRISDFASGLFAKFPEYEAFIEEQHHSRKKDAPSGTALKLKEIVAEHINLILTLRRRGRAVFPARIASVLTARPIRSCSNTRHARAKVLRRARLWPRNG